MSKSPFPDHSAYMAAHGSNHSASSVAASHNNSVGLRSDGVSDKNLEEGLMVNSNPSSPI